MTVIPQKSDMARFTCMKADDMMQLCVLLFFFGPCRDGRQLRRERKPKNLLALNRFLQKKSGLYGQQDSGTLEELGLPELAPSHCHRRGNALCLRKRNTEDMEASLRLHLPLLEAQRNGVARRHWTAVVS